LQATTLILGLGNTLLLSDEAVGPRVVEQLRQEAPAREGIRYLDGGTLSFTLAEPIAAATRLIAVDAARLGEPPGTVRVFEGETMDHQLRAHAKSVHEVSLADLLDMARLTDSLPSRRALVGIEPAKIDWGECLSPPVAAAVGEATARIRALIERWQDGG